MFVNMYWHILLIFQGKTIGKQKLFDTANNIIRDVTNEHVTEQQQLPEGARTSQQNLIRMVNRARATTRPKDPIDLNFDVSILSKRIQLCPIM